MRIRGDTRRRRGAGVAAHLRALGCLLLLAATVGALGRGLVVVFAADVVDAFRIAAAPQEAPDRLVPALVVLASAVGLLLVACWLSVSVVLCVVEAVTHRAAQRIARPSLLRPRLVRLLVGAVVGTSVTGLALPAQAAPEPADPGQPQAGSTSEQLTAVPRAGWTARLDGLRLPDRTLDGPGPTGGISTSRPAGQQPQQGPQTRPDHRSQARAARHRVRPGESLWRIAAARLDPAAPATAVDAAWRRVYRLNREVVGPDPDLLQVGAVLHLPDDLGSGPPADGAPAGGAVGSRTTGRH